MHSSNRTSARLVLAGLMLALCTSAIAAPSTAEEDFVAIDKTLLPGQFTDPFVPPAGQMLVITDIFVQNTEANGGPLLDDRYAQMFMSGDPEDFHLLVVGDNPVSLRFGTGLRVKSLSGFRVVTLATNTAPKLHIKVTGYLAKRPAGFSAP
jgi:hypothetical protein